MATFTARAVNSVTGEAATMTGPFTVAAPGGVVSPRTGANGGTQYQHAQTAADFSYAQRSVGPGRIVKLFDTALPATWAGSKAAAICGAWPGVTPILCWTAQMSEAALSSFCRSVPRREVALCWQQEPENSGMPAAVFRAGWESQAAIIRAARPDLILAHCAAGFCYTAGSAAAAGEYLPFTCDVYCIDTYQHQLGGGGTWPAQGILTPGWTFDRWQRAVYRKRPGAAVGVSEYGVDACKGGAAARYGRVAADLHALRQRFSGQLWCLCYWWHSMALDCQHDWRFTDAATIAIWKQAAAGTLP